MFELTQELLILLGILLLIELTLMLYSFNDLRKQHFDNRLIWAIVILIANPIGPIAYFLFSPRESLDFNIDEL